MATPLPDACPWVRDPGKDTKLPSGQMAHPTAEIPGSTFLSPHSQAMTLGCIAWLLGLLNSYLSSNIRFFNFPKASTGSLLIPQLISLFQSVKVALQYLHPILYVLGHFLGPWSWLPFLVNPSINVSRGLCGWWCCWFFCIAWGWI